MLLHRAKNGKKSKMYHLENITVIKYPLPLNLSTPIRPINQKKNS